MRLGTRRVPNSRAIALKGFNDALATRPKRLPRLLRKVPKLYVLLLGRAFLRCALLCALGGLLATSMLASPVSLPLAL